MLKRYTWSLLSVCVVSALCAPARAQSLYGGLLGGYAATTDKQNGVEPYGVGIGASAGITLPVLPIYLGARVVQFLGDSATLGAGGTTLKLNSRYLLYGVDVGYDAILGPIVLRPGIGVGAASLTNSGSAVGVKVSASDTSLYLAPGIGLVVKLGLLYVGGEARFNYLTADKHVNSVSLLASLGLTL